jgi:hypothetical protein
MHGPVDPKPPTRVDAAAAIEVEKHLRSRESFKKLGIAAQLLFGLPALLFGPITLSSIYWVTGLLWGMYVPWTWVFLASLIVLVPLLFWTERRSGGDYYAVAVRSTHGSSDGLRFPMTGLLDVDLILSYRRNPRDVGIGLVELFLWGPRQILEAKRTFWGMAHLSMVSRSRAAEMLLTIERCDHVDLTTLCGNDVDSGNVIAYLVWYDWIGISADTHRAWLESDSREVLEGSRKRL